MALVSCPECGREVSDQAAACPQCAYPFGSVPATAPSAPSPAVRESGAGSGGNVLAAFLSFVIPGLGQLTQGRLGAAALMFFSSMFLWLVLLGWIMHLVATIEAATWKG